MTLPIISLPRGEAFELVEDFLNRIFSAPEHLALFPGAGKPGRVPGTREWRVQNTPYALIYAVRETAVYVLRIMDNIRQFPMQ